MTIRTATDADRTEILKVHKIAFGPEDGPVIAALVNDLLDDATAQPLLSLVALGDGQITGHILFTRAELPGSEPPVSVQLLAPLAVVPGTQGQGIGQKLITAGLEKLAAGSVDLVFVLGHPGYYPRCGFQPAGVLGLDAPYPIPEKNAGAWMVQELKPGLLGKVTGTLQCARKLDEAEHWVE